MAKTGVLALLHSGVLFILYSEWPNSRALAKLCSFGPTALRMVLYSERPKLWSFGPIALRMAKLEFGQMHSKWPKLWSFGLLHSEWPKTGILALLHSEWPTTEF